ncbi:MAG: hypothetical protein ACPGYT_10760, partial [Nitrospirales bacterium]
MIHHVLSSTSIFSYLLECRQKRKTQRYGFRHRNLIIWLFVILATVFSAHCVGAKEIAPSPMVKRSVIPILGTTYNEQWEQVGIVAEVELEFIERQDHDGLHIDFLSKPGRFSSLAQSSV